MMPRPTPRPARARIAAGLAAFLSLGCGGARAEVVEQLLSVPVVIRHARLGEIRADIPVAVFRDTARARSPYLLLGHGRAASAADRAAMGRARYTENSRYFVSLGFAVFVPTRIGYGAAGGPDAEDSGNCASKDYPPGYDAAAQLSAQVIDHARGLPWVDPRRGVVVGQSYGGTTAIALAARPPDGLQAAINFAGGGGGRPATHPGQPCSPERLESLFAGYGRDARLPTLWLYAENDRFMGAVLPKRWFEAFRSAGGSGGFVQLPAHGADGHGSFTRNPDAWRPQVEAFLRQAGAMP
jgi:dienelactone hydrolase